MPGTARQEAQRAFDIVFLVANSAGFSREEIVFVDLAFQNLDDLIQVNSLYEELFAPDRRPARTVYQAARLPYGAKVKVQAVAARS